MIKMQWELLVVTSQIVSTEQVMGYHICTLCGLWSMADCCNMLCYRPHNKRLLKLKFLLKMDYTKIICIHMTVHEQMVYEEDSLLQQSPSGERGFGLADKGLL